MRAFFKPYFLDSFSRAVAGEESGLLERRASLFVEGDECPGDTEAQCAGLTRDTTAVDGGVDVVGFLGLDGPQRLGQQHPVHR